ncbi:hypothetical protein [Actinomycetospora chiangmaiensis]|uniref:hypothetical protein n=1 Tax=Actinomycetospora chiangmaiensis TaxID=402650 RepID=UPI00035D2706|nr:hypothetical protein [Actinomycetospora chiangmaiensis]
MAALAAATALVQLITAFVGFPTASVAGADWSTMAVATLPAFGIAAGAGAIAMAASRRTVSTAASALVLGLAVLTAGLASSPDTSPGPVVGMLAVAMASLTVIDARFALSGGAIEVPLAWWWTGGCGAAALYELVISHEVDGGTAGEIVAGVLFLLLSLAGGICASELRSGRAAPRWTVVIGLPVALIAAGAGDIGSHVVWPLLVVHGVLAALVVRPLVPALSPTGDAVTGARDRLLALSPAVRLGIAGGLVVLTGLVLAAARWTSTATSSSGYYSSDDYSSTGSFSGGTAAVVIVGVLALGAVFTPTMTPLWRTGLVASGGFAMWLGWHDTNTLHDGESTLLWTVAAPLVIVGSAVWGAWTNRRTGATATRPGWVGEGTLPPMLELPFVAPPTAGARSRTCLEVSTTASTEAVLDAVVRMTGVRGNWFRTYGDEVEVVGRSAHLIKLKIGGTCTFRAQIAAGARNELRVGGMDTWTKSRWTLDFIIPISPAKVEGFRMYKLYLRAVASEIARLDPASLARIGKATG